MHTLPRGFWSPARFRKRWSTQSLTWNFMPTFSISAEISTYASISLITSNSLSPEKNPFCVSSSNLHGVEMDLPGVSISWPLCYTRTRQIPLPHDGPVRYLKQQAHPLGANIPRPSHCSSYDIVLDLLIKCLIKIHEILFHLMVKFDVLLPSSLLPVLFFHFL